MDTCLRHINECFQEGLGDDFFNKTLMSGKVKGIFVYTLLRMSQLRIAIHKALLEMMHTSEFTKKLLLFYQKDVNNDIPFKTQGKRKATSSISEEEDVVDNSESEGASNVFISMIKALIRQAQDMHMCDIRPEATFADVERTLNILQYATCQPGFRFEGR